jgi:hypothetical protein
MAYNALKNCVHKQFTRFYCNLRPKQIRETIVQVMNPDPGSVNMRPDVSLLYDTEQEYVCPEYVKGRTMMPPVFVAIRLYFPL